MSFLQVRREPLALTLADHLSAADPSSRLVIPVHEKDVSIPTTTSGFRLTIVGGTNAMTATDIFLFTGSQVGKTWAECATEIQTKVNAAIVAGGGAGTSTCSWSGDDTGGTTGVFTMAASGSTQWVVAAPSTGTDIRIPLFGSPSGTQNAAQWVGNAPRDRGNTGPGMLHWYVKGTLSYTTGCPNVYSNAALVDLLGLPTGGDTRQRVALAWMKERRWNTASNTNIGVFIADNQTFASAKARGASTNVNTGGSRLTNWAIMNTAGTVSENNAFVDTNARMWVGGCVIQGQGGARRYGYPIANSYNTTPTLVGHPDGGNPGNHATPGGNNDYFMAWIRRNSAANVTEYEFIYQYWVSCDTGLVVPS